MTNAIELTKEEYANATQQWGIAQKHYNETKYDNAYVSEEGAVVSYSHGELKITFFEGYESYEVALGEWVKDCTSKANAKKLVKFIVESGQKDESEIEDEDEEIELYNLYKKSK